MTIEEGDKESETIVSFSPYLRRSDEYEFPLSFRYVLELHC